MDYGGLQTYAKQLLISDDDHEHRMVADRGRGFWSCGSTILLGRQ